MYFSHCPFARQCATQILDVECAQTETSQLQYTFQSALVGGEINSLPKELRE